MQMCAVDGHWVQKYFFKDKRSKLQLVVLVLYYYTNFFLYKETSIQQTDLA